MRAKSATALLTVSIVLCFSGVNATQWEDLLVEADSLMAIGEYAPAESVYHVGLEVAEEGFGPDHANTAVSLHRLGDLYTEMGEFGAAESLLVSALTLRLKDTAQEIPDIASNRYDLATVYLYTGRLTEAEEELKIALLALTEVFGREHIVVAPYYHGLGAVCLQAGRYPEAEDYLRQSLRIKETALGAGHPESMRTLVNLGVLYGSLGRYDEAEPFLTRALAIAESILGREHPLVASVLVNLANVYTWRGDYVGARLAFGQALGIMETFLGPDHPDVAGCLDNLGTVAAQQGMLHEAMELHERALAIRERAFGPDHIEVAMSLSNLGAGYVELGEYARAKEILERALAIDSEVLGPHHLAVATDLENMGEAALWHGDLEEADSLYSRALAIKRGAAGPESHEFARTLTYLGTLRVEQERFDEAEALCRESKTIIEGILGEEHYAIAENLEVLSDIALLTNKPLQAARFAEEAVRIRQKALVENAIVLSEADALTYAGLAKRSLDKYLSCFSSISNDESGASLKPSDVIFSCKGQVSDGIFERNRFMLEGADTTTAALAENLRLARFRLAQMFVGGAGDDVEAHYQIMTELQDEIAGLEGELVMRSEEYRARKRYESVTARSVISELPDGCCLIEYIRYDHEDPVAGTSVPRYLAVVAAADVDPAVVSIGWAREVEGLVDEYRRHMLRVSRSGRRPTPVDLGEYQKIGAGLYEMLWAPVAAYVAGHDMVFIAPDGGLSLVSYAGLIDGEGRYLADDLAIHYLSSARDLVRLAGEAAVGEGLLAFGDPDYDAPASTEGDQSERDPDGGLQLGGVVIRSVTSDCEEFSQLAVSRLPGTLEEVRLVEARWKRSSPEPATVYTGSDASEERLKAEAQGHGVIHLATHGYFLNESCAGTHAGGQSGLQSAFAGENPLLFSGLLLAGANSRRGGDLTSYGEDGILTAYEVAMMDLRGTDLVVLSACETGLGEVREGEGVYGLRRAFQMAGARTVISALWAISDEATAHMAGLLYEREGTPIAESMRKAQVETMERLRSEGTPEHPFLWAGFVAMGDWD